MALDFNKFAEKGNKFIKELAKEFGHPEDTAKAGRKLRAILHALRGCLTVQESMQLLAQLPMFLKAVYVDGWNYGRVKKKIKSEMDFMEEVRRFDFGSADFDFKEDEDIEINTLLVFQQLRKYISPGEMEDLRAVLPKELKYFTAKELML